MILDIIIIGFIGRKFYELAHEYYKNRWGYGILGAVSFFAGATLGAVLVVVIGEYVSPGFTDTTSDKAVGFMGLPMGFIVCFILYKVLDRTWSRAKDEAASQALDSNLR